MDLSASSSMNLAGKFPPNGREAGLSPSDGLKRKNALWISWNSHRRTTGLCAAWDLPLHVVRSERNGPTRWIAQALETLELLRRHRPGILFVQNPSLALTVLAILARPLHGYYLVVDAHNEGVRPFDRPGAFVRRLTRRLLKSADATIVTNEALAGDVIAAGGRPLILPDSVPAPMLSAAANRPLGQAFDVAVIATYRPDEPIRAILKAAATMPEVRFAFSGDARRFPMSRGDLPANIHLTGFLPDPEYWRLLIRAAVICDLTLKPDCLVCGAYEGLALGKAMVLSDNPATREIFGQVAILTGSEPEEIGRALRKALAERQRLEANAERVRADFAAIWQVRADAARDAICAAAATGKRGRS